MISTTDLSHDFAKDRGRVLIVDDEPVNVMILCKLLRNHYATETAANGAECLQKVASFRPQLVLLDIMMPGLNGYDVCRQIKESRVGEFVQVILVSAKGSPAERLQGYAALADDYVVKPFNHDELLSKVRVQFRLWEAHGELRKAKAELELNNLDLERLVQIRSQQIVAVQDVTVFALAKLAESRDTDTGNHLIRIRAYSQILARQLQNDSPYAASITPEFLGDLYRSSPLHDIGKVGVPDSILRKPEPLTKSEFDVMKKHVQIGAVTLEEALEHAGGGFLIMAAQVARCHHERFDGTGYCAGMRGQEIPLSARIVALADVYDALTSRRPYKPPYDPDVARSIIVSQSGTHFDPMIVEAFQSRFDEFVTTGASSVDESNVSDADELAVT